MPGFNFLFEAFILLMGGVLGVSAVSIIATFAFSTAEHQQRAAEQMDAMTLYASAIILFVLSAMIRLFFSTSARVCIALFIFVIAATLLYSGMTISGPMLG